MVHTGEGHAIGRVLVQVAAAGVIGALAVLPLVGAVVGVLLGGATAAVVMAGVFAVVLVVALTAVAGLAPDASWLTGSRGGRICWAVFVGAGGTVLWLLSWDLTDAAGLALSRTPTLWVPASVVLFALMAALLLRRWYLAAGSLTVLVATALLVLKALADASPSALDLRFADDQIARGSLMATTVPGYRLRPGQGTWYLEPDGADPQARYISVGPRLGADPGECVYGAKVCDVETASLRYELFEDAQAYTRYLVGREVEVRGGLAVDRGTLRTAALELRPATDGEAWEVLPEPRPSTPDRPVREVARELARDLFGGHWH
ncbi:hypothetical protein BBK82_31615 [Lentzea guizhouensis]|uniref:Uncharacterized protein n=1 Tax=Lentzea guizhouensis TaxID=1586287 RepID=A0A1B2HQA3_9PSEU|nr:hypothetical protein [Lentzea guizhouensis]ANZ39914.1 hypothetical protein BBK82_31615 [Lentzea guizhouensis]